MMAITVWTSSGPWGIGSGWDAIIDVGWFADKATGSRGRLFGILLAGVVSAELL